jgi:hypothetical protein
MDTILRGNAAEAAVLNALIQADIGVALPFGGWCPFDVVVVSPDNGALLRWQVKSGRIRKGCVQFNTCSTDHGHGRQDYRGRADHIAVHVPRHPEIYVVPVDEFPSFTGALRLEPTRNNQQKGVRFASDYTLEAWVNALWERTGPSRTIAA